MLTPPSPVCRTEVEAAEGCSRLPPRSAAAWRAMNAWCAAMVAATVAGPARSQDCSSSQMNTTYSATSPASQQEPKVITAPPWSRRDDLSDLDVHAAGQPRAAGRQRGRGVQVPGVDDHISGQHRVARLAAARGGQGAGRADPVAHVGDRRAELAEPRSHACSSSGAAVRSGWPRKAKTYLPILVLPSSPAGAYRRPSPNTSRCT